MPVGDILRYNPLNWPDRVGVVAGERRITFSELQRSVWRLAGAMSGLCRPGDRVGILAQNVPEYVEALYAVLSVSTSGRRCRGTCSARPSSGRYEQL